MAKHAPAATEACIRTVARPDDAAHSSAQAAHATARDMRCPAGDDGQSASGAQAASSEGHPCGRATAALGAVRKQIIAMELSQACGPQ
jgi:hypothetical protein